MNVRSLMTNRQFKRTLTLERLYILCLGGPCSLARAVVLSRKPPTDNQWAIFWIAPFHFLGYRVAQKKTLEAIGKRGDIFGSLVLYGFINRSRFGLASIV